MRELEIKTNHIRLLKVFAILQIAVVRSILLAVFVSMLSLVNGCSSSETKQREEYEFEKEEESNVPETNMIFEAAKREQQNPMYSVDSDTTILYWLGNLPAELPGVTKCNVFALNVLQRAGYQTPNVNCLTSDMFDTTLYNNVFPVAGISRIDIAEPGDLLVWNGHVIIFEKVVSAGGEDYALGWWAGTRQEDNGNNIMNNVCYGKYRLDGEFVLRRPIKKKN